MSTDWNPILIVAGAMGFVLLAGMFLDRVVNPWANKRQLKKIVRDVQMGKGIEKPPAKFVISFDALGFTVAPAKGVDESLTMCWLEVQKVEAFKRDLFAVDLMCLFLSRSDSSGLELDEDMAGWSEIVQVLPDYLPGCQPNSKWFSDIAFPAFQTNLTTIFVRTADRLETVSA